MIQRIVLVFFLLWNVMANAQITNLLVKVDSSIDMNDLVFTFKDGINLHTVTDSFTNRELSLQKPIFAPYAVLQISQLSDEPSFLMLVNEEPAVVELSKDAKTQAITCSFNENVIDLKDTLHNPMLRDINEKISKDRLEAYDFITAHASELNKNDSIVHQHGQYIKRIIYKILPVIEMHAQDYRSFSYYKAELDYALNFIKEDLDFFRDQLHFVTETFPKDFLQSEEGKIFIRKIKSRITPISLHTKAPDFEGYEIQGSKIQLSDFKGKYVLLDFWATWCAPCLEQIPTLKQIKSEFSSDSLEIIGISVDEDPEAFFRVVRAKEMNWIHLLEEMKELTTLYGVAAFPTLILIDPSGEIVYRKEGGGVDFDLIKQLMRQEG